MSYWVWSFDYIDNLYPLDGWCTFSGRATECSPSTNIWSPKCEGYIIQNLVWQLILFTIKFGRYFGKCFIVTHSFYLVVLTLVYWFWQNCKILYHMVLFISYGTIHKSYLRILWKHLQKTSHLLQIRTWFNLNILDYKEGIYPLWQNFLCYKKLSIYGCA